MSHKKNLHKGKPKQSTTQSEDAVFRRDVPENSEEEYVTVVDFEANKKYSKRLVENNWAKYEVPLSDFECDVQEGEPKTEDFTSLLKTASSDYSHFQFSSEKLWKGDCSVPPSEIFNLDLDLLSSGLACVPFYERIGLNESELSEEDKKRFDQAAAENWKNYNLIREKCAKKPEVTDKPKSTLEDLFQVKVEDSKETSEPGEAQKSDNNKETAPGQKLFSSGIEENLEDWLDSVLDD